MKGSVLLLQRLRVGAERRECAMEFYGGAGGSDGSDHHHDGGGGGSSSDDPLGRKKRYHRHTAHQIQRLEA